MGLTLVIARMVLAGVFALAGVAKLADRVEFREMLPSFGLPAALAAPFAIILPLAELAVAAALFPVASAWWGAIGALTLLLLFVGGIGLNLAKGRKPKCRCFGQLHSAPVGWSTLLRNMVLAAIAGFIVGHGRSAASPSLVDWISELAPGQRIELLVGVILFALLAIAGLVLVQIVKQQGRMLRRLEIMEAQFTRGGAIRGLAVGTPAPGFALPDLNSEMITLDALRAKDLPVLLVFVDPECGPCEALLPQLDRWHRDYSDMLMLVRVSRGSTAANRAKFEHHRVGHLLVQQEREVDDAYKVEGTPAAVLVRADGTIGSPQALGADMIESLVAGMVGQLGPSPLLMAPPVKGNGHAEGGRMPSLAA